MATPFESAELILKLYDQRREETMRKARDFMVGFDPKSMEEMTAALMGEHSGKIRMVVGYWDMAASLVLNGAIDAKMFNDANVEHFVAFAKVEPYLPQLREILPNPNFGKNLEQLCMSVPDARQKTDKFREFFRAMIAMRAAAGKP